MKIFDVYDTIFTKFIGKDSVVFDVGANQGDYTAQFLRNGAMVHCFEPNPDMVHVLQNRYGKCDRVWIHPYGLNSTVGEGKLHITSHPRDCSFLTPTVGWLPFKETAQSIAYTRLDEACKQYNVTHIDFLKIDVQGLDLEVLRGCGEMMKNIDWVCVEILFIVMYDRCFTLKDFEDFFHEHNFKLFTMSNINYVESSQITHLDAVYRRVK